jgi:hypothetical protein
VYRNPLDQAVSFFSHSLKQKDERHRYYSDEEGRSVPIESVKEYIHKVGLESYIKQFLTYLVMHDRYPRRILMLSYESLLQDPQTHFATILDHFGHDVESMGSQNAFIEALRLSSMDSMKRLENSIWRSLGNDQTDSRERHIQGGQIGKWKKQLDKEDLKKIEQRLNQFGLSLSQFNIGE